MALFEASWPSNTNVPDTSKSALVAVEKSNVASLLPSASTVKVADEATLTFSKVS